MATRTFKIGEWCKGGIITVEITSKKIAVIAKDWDFSKGSRKSSDQSNAKEFDREEVEIDQRDGYNRVERFLLDLTTSYYTEKVIEYIQTKVPQFKRQYTF
jgi:hypothetical protein